MIQVKIFMTHTNVHRKDWRWKLDYMKNFQAKYSTGDSIVIYRYTQTHAHIDMPYRMRVVIQCIRMYLNQALFETRECLHSVLGLHRGGYASTSWHDLIFLNLHLFQQAHPIHCCKHEMIDISLWKKVISTCSTFSFLAVMLYNPFPDLQQLAINFLLNKAWTSRSFCFSGTQYIHQVVTMYIS